MKKKEGYKIAGVYPMTADGDPVLPVSSEQAQDWFITDMMNLADDGDDEAALELHRALAGALRDGTITELVINTLADMHQSIAEGVPAATATLTQKLPGRSRNDLRDRQIINRIDGVLQMYDAWDRNREMAEARFPSSVEKFKTKPKLTGKGGLYEKVAAEFGLRPSTIANIHSAKRTTW